MLFPQSILPVAASGLEGSAEFGFPKADEKDEGAVTEAVSSSAGGSFDLRVIKDTVVPMEAHGASSNWSLFRSS
jgi:hypothetical protein